MVSETRRTSVREYSALPLILLVVPLFLSVLCRIVVASAPRVSLGEIVRAILIGTTGRIKGNQSPVNGPNHVIGGMGDADPLWSRDQCLWLGRLSSAWSAPSVFVQHPPSHPD